MCAGLIYIRRCINADKHTTAVDPNPPGHVGLLARSHKCYKRAMAETLDSIGRKLDLVLSKIDNLTSLARITLAQELLMENIVQDLNEATNILAGKFDALNTQTATLTQTVADEKTALDAAVVRINQIIASGVSPEVAAQLATIKDRITAGSSNLDTVTTGLGAVTTEVTSHIVTLNSLGASTTTPIPRSALIA